MFSNHSSAVGDGGDETKLLFTMEEEYCKDEDGDGETHAASKKGAATMGGLVRKQIILASNVATGSVSIGCNHMSSTAGVPLCVKDMHHDCIINNDLMVVIMTVSKDDQDNVNIICLTMRDCDKKDGVQGDHLSVVITRDAATNDRVGNNNVPSTLNLLSNIDKTQQRKNGQSAQARVLSLRCFKGGYSWAWG
jgi:hypothetical protein